MLTASLTSTGRALSLRSFLGRRLEDPSRLRAGVRWLVATAVAYAGVMVVLAAGGDRPGDFRPWLAIPAADYFWWEALFIGPVIMAGGLLATSSMYLMARVAGGTGGFDDTFALVGPAIAGCTLFTLIPDLIIGMLLTMGAMDADAWLRGVTEPSPTLAFVWTYLVLYTAAFLVAFPAVIAAAHRLRIGSAIAVGWAGFAIYQSLLFVFVR